MPQTHYRICSLCEATCGLTLEVEDHKVTSVRGDDDDVFSHGFLCPKGAALPQLHEDPDRLRKPLVRRDGVLVETTWDDAFAEIERRLLPIIQEHGNNAVAVYLGNPNVHNVALTLYGQALLRTLRTTNIYSASTVDQIPKQLAGGLMFGTFTTVAVPDIERCDFLLVLGANPFDSNGSLWTVPDFPGKLRDLRQRGGQCVVVDPRRTRTAAAADQHLAIRPGADAQFLMAIISVLFSESLVRLGDLAHHVNGVDDLRAASADFTPAAVAEMCGIDAATITDVARCLAKADHAAVYGRIGTCTQEFGTVASWLVDACNILTGNFDRPGGAMFPMPPAFSANTHGQPGIGRGVITGRRRSRVRQAPEVMGELPVACLAEEIETPGKDQVRALIAIAGNPLLSTPNGGRLAAAFEQLDFMLSLDIYLNETSRHADVILPGRSPLETPHFDATFPLFAFRNAVRFSPPVFAPPSDQPAEWQTLLRLTAIVSGQGAGADVAGLDEFVATTQVQRAVGDPNSPIHGRDVGEIMKALEPRVGPERLIDLALRSGPYGDGFGANPTGVSLTKVESHPHGIDLGPLKPRVPEVLRTPSGKIELAPAMCITDVERMRAALRRPQDGGLVLIGRRHLRSNNSWLHNVPILAGGRPRCTLMIHPHDAVRLGLKDGAAAHVRSRAGSVTVDVEITDTIRPGVVSLPHGWGHSESDMRLNTAAKQPGVNSNLLTDEAEIDPLSGNAVLNNIPVTVEAA